MSYFSAPWRDKVALVVKNLPANAGDRRGSIPGSGRFPGGGHGNPLQYSCLENPMDTGAWWAIVHRVTKTQTRLKRLRTHMQRDNKGGRGRGILEVGVVLAGSPFSPGILLAHSAPRSISKGSWPSRRRCPAQCPTLPATPGGGPRAAGSGTSPGFPHAGEGASG